MHTFAAANTSTVSLPPTETDQKAAAETARRNRLLQQQRRRVAMNDDLDQVAILSSVVLASALAALSVFAIVKMSR